jgi:hypothetical protein
MGSLRGFVLLGFAVTGIALASAGNSAPAKNGPGFHGRIASIGPALRAHMTSWHRGCPVTISRLRLLTLTYWGFDRAPHQGRLIVNESQAANVLSAMRTLYSRRFPIRRMRLVEAYGSNDDRSMAADNSSGFNCRGVPGSSAWSAHAYGLAVDLNPRENPEVREGVVSPSDGAAFTDRSRRARGMIHAGDSVVRAFAAIGWKWGGYWHSLKDYQHFSSTGL